jgi:hypothetical protein
LIVIDSLRALPPAYLAVMGLWLAAGLLVLRWLLQARRGAKNRPRRLRVVHALLSLWMLLAALTGLELYFAVLYDESDSFNMTNVSRKWFRRHVVGKQRVLPLDERTIVLYRDDRDFPSASTGQHHICFVGDSFTFGHGISEVADRFSNRVRAGLERRSPGRFAVSNLARAGVELMWIVTLVERLVQEDQGVDTFVYVVCLNDIEAFHSGSLSFYRDLGRHDPQFFLFRHSYFFNFAWFRLVQFAVPEVRNYYSFVREFYAGEPWREMRATIEDLHGTCERHGVGFRVVVFPFLHNLGAGYPFRDVHARIMAACRAAGIPALDLDPVLAPHAGEGLTVNRFDAHPNERAHELAAAAIERWLMDDLVESGENESSP